VGCPGAWKLWQVSQSADAAVGVRATDWQWHSAQVAIDGNNRSDAVLDVEAA
jgi:hypothetical protein